MMNTTDTETMNKGAVAASKAIDAVTSFPGRLFRAPGNIVRNINSGLYKFWSDFRSLRAEVKREKAQGEKAIEHALRLVDEARKEKAETLKEVTAMAEENIRLAKKTVAGTRQSVRRRVKLATERMADQKSINRMEREAEEIQSRIDAYELRIQELEAQLFASQADANDAPVTVEDDAFSQFDEVRGHLFEAQAKAEAVTEAEEEEVVTEPAAEETADEVIPTGEGFQKLLREKGQEAQPPKEEAFHAASSEVADAPDVPAGAGVPLKDEGADDKL